jgi:fatty acid desaturase
MRANELRAALRRELPPEVFDPQPLRGVLAFGEAALMGALGAWLALYEPPWPVALLVSLVMGQLLTAVALSAHEAMHGAVFRRRWLRELLCWVGLGPLLITPGMWVAWHVQAHHGHTNRHGLDPDAMFDASDYPRSWLVRWRARMTLGSESRTFSALSLLWLFTLQGQIFLWLQCDEPRLRDKLTLDRTRERALTVLLALGGLALGAWLGLPDAVWILLLPAATANLTLMLYISTQHWLQPHVEEDDPVRSTMSVLVPRWCDWLHFGFSYHQEHHLFPKMSHKYGPLVRETAERLAPGALRALPIGTILRLVHATPSMYRDARTLSSSDGRQLVDLEEVRVVLQDRRE